MKALKIEFPYNLTGAIASGLCLIHCLASPLLFTAQAGLIAQKESHPLWWGFVDIIFLLLSYIAVWRSGKTTSKPFVKWILWASWMFLVVVILNEKLSIIPLSEAAIFIPSLSLIFFHLYNRKYCTCKGNECCTHG